MFRSALESISPDLIVTNVLSGEEALLLLAYQPADLAVIKVRLVGLSGLELMRKAKRRAPGLKVILITGATDPEARKQVAEARADAFFYQPVEMQCFLAAVERCLGRVRSVGVDPEEAGEEKSPAEDQVEELEIPKWEKDGRQEQGIPPQLRTPEADGVGEASPELIEIFRHAEQSPANSKDLDAFWEGLSEQGDLQPGSGILSYEQARKLGLALDP